MTTSVRRAAGLVLTIALVGLAAGCGGGFSSAPAAPPTRVIKNYVALGDGFSAAPYTGKTADDDGCLRSDDNFPALLAKELNVDKVRDVSCTGATTASFTTQVKPPRAKSEVPAQIAAVKSDTDLVTISMGIEDRDLLKNMFAICTAVPCGDKATPQTILGDVGSMSTALTTAVRAIQDDAPQALIVLVGYPAFIPDAGKCDDLPKLDQLGLDSANLIVEAINREINDVARETGVAFLDVARLSAGHELCSGRSWVTGKDSERGKSVAYHPVAAEQKAVADGIAALVKSQ